MYSNTSKLLLKEYLELDWSIAINYFWKYSVQDRELKKTQYYILTMKNLGYERQEIFEFITSGILFISLKDASDYLTLLGA